MTAVLLSLATFVSTLAGGLFALRFRDRLHYLLAFTAGVLLGVVAFDILPEIFDIAGAQGAGATGPMIALVAGFLVFHGLEKFVLLHHVHEEDYAEHRHPQLGLVSAFALAGHSFMDGVGIGLAFQAGPTIGVAVALAVIAHDFCDGLNTVGLMLSHRNPTARAVAMLGLDAVAPVAGAASTLLFSAPPGLLALFLGFFAGFLLYISTSDILPEAHSAKRPGAVLVLMGLTCLGAAFIFFAVRAAG